MSSQVLRATSGDVIQVRTGTIQGIGPQGPVGPAGPPGDKGDQGAQGIPGPTGSIADASSEFWNTATQSISSALSYTTMIFGENPRDDLLIQASVTNFVFPVGTYQGTAYVKFGKQAGNAVGSRGVQVLYDTKVIGAVNQAASPSLPHEISIPFEFKVTQAGLILNIQVQQNEGAQLNVTGRLFVSRVGPGAQGPTGPQGTPGAQGAKGDKGDQGSPGAVTSDNLTYAQMVAP